MHSTTFIPRPLAALRAWARERKDIWRAVDALRATRKADNASWPSYVYLPLAQAGAIVARRAAERGERYERGDVAERWLRESHELSCYAAWRVGQGIYRYDATLYDALIATPVTGDLPADTLIRLPEWCVYIETPGMTVPAFPSDAPLHGFWAWLDYVENEHLDVLTIGFDAQDAPLAIQHVPLAGTLDQALLRVLRDWQSGLDSGAATQQIPPQYQRLAQQILPPILSLLLYLCADEADLGPGRPVRPQPKRTKHGWRMFAADQPRTWDVGVRLGAALRRAEAAAVAADAAEPGSLAGPGTRARMRPHLRRAHWHTFRVGPGRADRRLRWLPPIPINLDPHAELPGVLHPVQP